MLDEFIEAILQILFEAVLQALADTGARRVHRVMGSRTGRAVVGVIVGFVGGLIWGAHATSTGLGHEPRSLWVSAALGVIAVGMAFRPKVPAVLGAPAPPAARSGIMPWTWPRFRLLSFALLNVAVAVGIVLAFHAPAH